ncbi:MAG TPA: ABC transporter permease [Fimbriimonadaceae bacterium]|nr:ABC transporter permease [Fimbriimonadaceae bacterium]HRJ95100.1 ABC transporter permease [Fimbriimonadaceae bacterium]
MSGRLITLILVSFLLVIGALMLAGVMPLDALSVLGETFRQKGAWTRTLRETTPLLIAGVAVFLGLRAGLFNIGVEGQFLLGALTAAFVGLLVSGPLGVILAVIAGSVAGALWAWPAGWIKAYRGGHEVITTIMLNNVAAFFTTWLVAGPLKAPNQESTTTAALPAMTRLPSLYSSPPFFLNVALLLAVLMVVALAIWLKRTVAGYELSATGANAIAAEVAGVNVKRMTVRAMAASGAIGGLAGACQVLAYEWRFYEGFSPGYGFDALGVALLAGATPWGLLPASVLFGLLTTSSTALAANGVPRGLNGVLLGLLIIGFAAYRYRRKRT